MVATGASSIAQPKARSFRFYKWSAISLLCLLGVVNFADKTIIGFAAVPIMRDLNLSHEQFGLVGSAFFWLFSISALVIGRLSDRFSTKSLLAIMASVWASMQFATVFVSTLPQLVATRVVLGAAEGPSYNLSIHATAKWLSQSQRGFGFALVTIGSAMGPALAAPTLLYVIYHFSWRAAFTMLGVIGATWVAAWLMISKESPEAVGMESPEGAIAGNERTVIAWRDLMPAIFSRDFILVVLSGFTSYWALALLIVWVPSYLEEVRHLTHVQAQMYEGLPWLAGAVASLVLCAIADWMFRRTQSSRKSRVYMMGATGLSSAVCWYLFVSAPNTSTSVIFLVIAAAMGGPVFPLGNAIAADMVLPEHRGTLLGLLLACTTCAGLIAPAVSGLLIQHGATTAIGYYNAFALMAGMNLVTATLLVIGVHPPRPGTTPRYVQKIAAR